MNKLLAIFLIFIIIIALLILSTAAFWHHNDKNEDFDSQYLDEDGHHVYYDRSIIEKKDYAKRTPTGLKNVRKFTHLFRKES